MKIAYANIMKAVSDEKVICWSDLLEKLQLVEYFKRYKDRTGQQYDIRKVFMGKTLMDKIDETLKERCLKSKDRRIKHLRGRYKLNVYAMDCLQSQPCTAKEDIDYMDLKDL